MRFIYFKVKSLEPLINFQNTSNWEGIIINNSLQKFKNTKIPLYISLIKICKRKIIFPIGNKIKILIFSIFNIIKTKFLILLCIFKLFSLVNLKILSNYLNLFPCGNYIVDRISFDSSFEYANLNSVLQIDIDTMFIIIFLFIILITLIIINLMIIFIIMIFLYIYKFYKFFVFIKLILPVYNFKILITGCKICAFISINILKIFNIGISPESLLFIFNAQFYKFFEFC